MALRKNHVEDKVRPGINFLLSVPVRFNVSSNNEFLEKFNKYCDDKKISPAKLSRKMLFEFFTANDLNELIRINSAIKKSILNIGDVIKDEMGLSSREFSIWFRQAFDEKNQ